jgi:hypothetical protein
MSKASSRSILIATKKFRTAERKTQRRPLKKKAAPKKNF